jgi:hypothetical protein
VHAASDGRDLSSTTAAATTSSAVEGAAVVDGNGSSGAGVSITTIGAAVATTTTSPSTAPPPPAPPSRAVSSTSSPSGRQRGLQSAAAEREQEQKIAYLRQAFCGFVKAKHEAEMENLGRVICAILGLSPEEQASIMEHISRLTPAVVATTTFEVLSSNLSSIFG